MVTGLYGLIVLYTEYLSYLGQKVTTSVSRDHGDHLGQTQVITSYYLGQSYYLDRNIYIVTKGGFPVMAETTRNHIFSKEISQVIIAAMVLAPNFY